MKGNKVLEVRQEKYGTLFKTKNGTLIFQDKSGEQKVYPLFDDKIGAVVLKSGGLTTVSALVTCAFFSIPVVFVTTKGNPIAFLKSFDDDSHVITRINQYKALENGKGEKIARVIVGAKAQGYNVALQKYGLPKLGYLQGEINEIKFTNPESFRRQLMSYESKFTKRYFDQIFSVINPEIRPTGRTTYMAYDAVNNALNLGYTVLRWKVHIAIVRASLEPHLGFVHSLQYSKPSLTLDFMELYRYLIDSFVIGFCKDLTPSDFVFKDEMHGKKKGKRQYLNPERERIFLAKLNCMFRCMVSVPRLNVGWVQEVESLINEEALQLAKYVRDETKYWEPRTAGIL